MRGRVRVNDVEMSTEGIRRRGKRDTEEEESKKITLGKI
jgi:hypothetical protein